MNSVGDEMKSSKKKRLSYFAKLFICFAVISIVPVAILGTLVYTISSNVSMSNLEYLSMNTVDKATLSLDRTMEEYQSALSVFCKDNEMIHMLNQNKITETNRTSIYQKMYILLAGKSTKMAMHLIKADGSFQLSTSVIPDVYDIKNHSDWGVYRKINASEGTVTYSNRYVSQTGKSYCMTIAHSIKSRGETIGYAIIDIPADVFQTALDAVNVSLPIRYAVVDENNYLLYDEIFTSEQETFLDTNFRNRMLEAERSKKLYLDAPKRFLTWNITKGQYPLRIISSIPVELVVLNSNYIMVTTFAVAVCSIFLCLILSPLIVRSLTKPLNAIVHTMDRVQGGDTEARVAVKNNDEFGYIGTSLNEMLDKLNELFATNLEKQNRLRLSEMKALYAQINPHFLYNTLDSIKWLAKLNGVNDIVVIVSQLGKLLKSSIRNEKDSVQISEEIGLVRSYLAIQKVRYGDKFDAEIDVDEEIQSCMVPKFIIQPIVENAIIHGIEDKIDKAHLTIKGWRENDKIILEIKDDGVGISKENLERIRNLTRTVVNDSDSIGVANVDKRIKLYYGEEYGLNLASMENVGTIARITMPFFVTPIQDEKEGQAKL
jgi:two-component system sensor histidine kinase YesM